MNIGINQTFKHKHITNLTCVILSETSKGWKVQTTETFSRKKNKTKIEYYHKIDFDKEKGFWINQ